MAFDRGVWGVFKYCPKCAAAAMRVVGPKLLHCDVCGFELYMNPAAAVAGVLADSQGRIVVLVRGKEPSPGRWDLPGGFVDPGETAEEALQREIEEELGLEATVTRYLGSWPNVYEYVGIPYRTLDFGFVCKAPGADRVRPMEDDIAEVLLLRPEEVEIGRFAFASVGKIADAYLRQRRPAGAD